MNNKKQLDVSFDSITVMVEIPEKKMHKNHLGNATVTIKGIGSDYITISGFTIWKSKFEDGGNTVQVPQRQKNWKFWFSDQGTLRDITELILEEYEMENIPIV